MLDVAKKQVTGVQSTVEGMIRDQASKCKDAGWFRLRIGSRVEKQLQKECDGLVEKLHGLVGSYDGISKKCVVR